MVPLGKITLPPEPGPAKTLEEYQRKMVVWTRQVEQTVRQLERYLRSLEAELLRVPRP